VIGLDFDLDFDLDLDATCLAGELFGLGNGVIVASDFCFAACAVGTAFFTGTGDLGCTAFTTGVWLDWFMLFTCSETQDINCVKKVFNAAASAVLTEVASWVLTAWV
jgi:hypothetical protein